MKLQEGAKGGNWERRYTKAAAALTGASADRNAGGADEGISTTEERGLGLLLLAVIAAYGKELVNTAWRGQAPPQRGLLH